MLQILMLVSAFCLSQELKVEGDLKVTGNIDVQNNPITNVGTPVLDTDATNLSTVRSMLGMKPERIYSKFFSNESFSLQVPQEKIWYFKIGLDASCYTVNDGRPAMNINGNTFNLGREGSGEGSYVFGTSEFYLLQGNTVSFNWNCTYTINILEYPFSNSGTDQGMDYIEP